MTKFIIHISHMEMDKKLVQKMFLNKNDVFYKTHQRDIILIASIASKNQIDLFRTHIYLPYQTKVRESYTLEDLYQKIKNIYLEFNITATYAYVEANLSSPAGVLITQAATDHIKKLKNLANLQKITLFTETETINKQKSKLFKDADLEHLPIMLTSDVAIEYQAKLTADENIEQSSSSMTTIIEPWQSNMDEELEAYAGPDSKEQDYISPAEKTIKNPPRRNMWACFFLCQRSSEAVSDSFIPNQSLIIK